MDGLEIWTDGNDAWIESIEDSYQFKTKYKETRLKQTYVLLK